MAENDYGEVSTNTCFFGYPTRKTRANSSLIENIKQKYKFHKGSKHFQEDYNSKVWFDEDSSDSVSQISSERLPNIRSNQKIDCKSESIDFGIIKLIKMQPEYQSDEETEDTNKSLSYVEKLILNAVSPEKKVVLGQIFNNNYARYRSVSPIKRLKENDYTLGFKNLVQRPSVSLRRRKYKKSLSELKYQPNQSATIKKPDLIEVRKPIVTIKYVPKEDRLRKIHSKLQRIQNSDGASFADVKLSKRIQDKLRRIHERAKEISNGGERIDYNNQCEKSVGIDGNTQIMIGPMKAILRQEDMNIRAPKRNGVSANEFTFAIKNLS